MPSSTIEKKLVQMDFDNSRFEKNVDQSISTLDRLKGALNLDGAAKSFNRLEQQLNSINFSGLEKSIGNIENRFSALGIAGATVVTNLTNKVIGAVSKMNNAVFGQIKSGGLNRALNLEHANFMLEGLLKNADKVAEIMGESGPVQKAVKGTAYGLDEAAKAASQFVASGIKDTDKLEQALTGISGAAAMTGSSYTDIANIFTTIAGNGRLYAVQLQQFAARGINAAAALGTALGKSEAEIREMTRKGQIDFETFAKVMNDTFGAQAKKANNTFTGAMSNVKAALSRIGAKVATPGIENLRVVFVKLIDVIDNTSKTLQPLIDFINRVFYSITEGIALFLAKTGDIDRVVSNVISTIGYAIQALYSFLLPVKRALENFFPPKTVSDVITLTEKMKYFTKTLILGADQMVTVRRIFQGVFGAFDIAIQIISALIRVLFPATNGIRSFIGSFANGAATVGDYITAISRVLRETDAIYGFFKYLEKKAAPILNAIGKPLSDIFNSIKSFINSMSGKASNIPFIKNIEETSPSLEKNGSMIAKILRGIGGAIKEVSPLFESFGKMVGRSLGEVGNAFTKVFNGGGFKTILSLASTGILTTIAVDIAYFISTIVGTFSKGIGLINIVKSIFGSINRVIKTQALKIQSEAILNFAKAVGILVGSLVLLSLIDPGTLVRSIGAVTVVMGELIGVAFLLTKISSSLKGSLSMFANAISFTAIAASIMILAASLKTVSEIDPNRLDASLGVITILIGELTVVSLILSNNSASLIKGAYNLIYMAQAVKVLGQAMAQIGSLNPSQFVQGLKGVTVAMAELAVVAKVLDGTKFGMGTGVAMVLMATSLRVLGGAISQMGSLQPEVLAKGLVAVASALAEISVFMTIMGDANKVLSTATAMGILSLALLGIANVVNTLGSLSLADMAQGLAGMVAALIAAGAALTALSDNALGAIGAATAMGILAISLNALLPILSLLADMKFGSFIKTMGEFVILLGTLGAAAAIFGNFSTLMMKGALAIAALGASCAIAAIGLGAIVIALQDLNTISWGELVNGLGKIVVILGAIALGAKLLSPGIDILLKLSATMIAIGLAALALASTVSVAAFGLSLMAEALKKFEDVSWGTIGKGLLVLVAAIGGFAVAAYLLAPLAPVILAIGVGVAAFGAGALMASTSLLVLAKAIEVLGPHLSQLGQFIVELLASAWNKITKFFADLKNNFVKYAADFGKFVLDLGASLLKGLVSCTASILHALVDLGAKMLKALGVPEEWVDVAKDFMHGLITGIANMLKFVIDKVKDVGKAMIDGIRDAIDSHSDSKETIAVGEDFDGGLITGVGNLKDKVVAAVGDVGKGMIDQAKSDANKVVDVWEATVKTYGKSLDFDVGLKSGNIKYVGTGIYLNTKTNEQKNLVNSTRDAINTIDQESAALSGGSGGGNTGKTKKNTKAKEENKKANDKKTKAINEESEALNEETQEVENNEEAIREQAEQIEVVTEKFDEALNFINMFNGYNGLPKMTRLLSNFWSKGLSTSGFKSVNSVSKSFKSLSKNLTKMPKNLKDVSFAFDSTGKYAGKVSSLIGKSDKTIKNYVDKTGKTLVKVVSDQAKVFEKAGNSVYSYKMRLTKNVKDMGKQIKAFKEFQGSLSTLNYGSVQGIDSAKQFIDILRGIQTYYVKVKDIPENVQAWMWGINNQVLELDSAYNALGRNIGKINGNYLNPQSQVAAYVQDAFISLAATLYDGSEAANEYATEHERLLFLMENGLATQEEVDEHFQSYIKRIMDTLKAYRDSIEENLRGSMNIFEKFNQNLMADGDDLLDNIESQIAGMTQWSDMLMELSKRSVDVNILKMLTDEGTSSFGKLKKMLSMTKEELALFNQRYKESEQAIRSARDTSLAALANATTFANQRAAAASKKLTKEQLAESARAAKRLISDARAVADNQARYRSFTKLEEKKYLATLTEEARKAYNKRLKDQKKYLKQEQKLAKKADTLRKQKKDIQDNVKSFDSLIKIYQKYQNSASAMVEINKQINESLKSVKDNIHDTNGYSADDMRWSWIKFAETLEDTGSGAENYFDELKARIETYVKSVRDAVNITQSLFEEFKTADKVSLDKMFGNAADNLSNMQDLADLTKKAGGMGLSADFWTYYKTKYIDSKDFAGAVAFLKEITSASKSEIDAMLGLIKKAQEASEAAAKALEDSQVSASGGAQLKVIQDAEDRLNRAKASLASTTASANKDITALNKEKTALENEMRNLERERIAAATIPNKNERAHVLQMLADAQQDALSKYNNITRLIAERQKSIAKATEEVNKSEKELSDALKKNAGSASATIQDATVKHFQSEYDKAVAAKNAAAKAAKDSQTNIDKAKKAKAEAEKALKNYKNKSKSFISPYKDEKAAKKALDDAKKIIDTETKKIKALTDAELAEAEAKRRLADAQTTANKTLTNEEAAAAREKNLQTWLKSIKSLDLLNAALKKVSKTSEEYGRIQKALKESLSGIKGAIDQYGSRWLNIANLSDTVSTNLDNISTAFLEFAENLGGSDDDSKSWFENMGQRLAEYRDSLDSTIRSQINLFDEFKKFSGNKGTTASKYLDNMSSQINGLEEWLTNLELLAKKGVSKDIIQMFASEGISSFEKVAAFVQASESEVGELNSRMKQYQDLVAEAADRAMATVGYSYTESAKNLQDKLMKEFEDSGVQRIKEAAEDGSKMLITGIKNGVTNAMPEIIGAVANTAKAVTNAIANEINTAPLMNAISSGLTSANATLNVANISGNAINGFYDTVTEEAITKFKMAVDSINEYINMNLQTEYTITVHVNTSEIDEAVARMNNAIGNTRIHANDVSNAYVQSYQAPTPTAVFGAPAPSVTNNITYEQNNYSPKALSRTEIYRQTRNQLSTISDVVASASGG